MLCYGLLTNPSNEILGEITKAYELDFEYVEIGIEGPQGNPLIIEKKKNEILELLQNLNKSQLAILHIGLILPQIMSILDMPGFLRL